MKYLNRKTVTLMLSALTVMALTGCGTDGVPSDTQLVGSVGKLPIAVADVDPVTIVCPSANPVKVKYDGSQSNDPDGKIISYTWFVTIDGKKEALSDKVTGEISDICKEIGDRRGTYEVGLTVEDNDGNRASDVTKVEIVDNKPPIAQAGADNPVEVNTTIHLDAKDSYDPDGVIVAYQWNEGDTVLSTASTFDYKPTTIGDHVVILTVTDDVGNTGKDTVIITAIETSNNLPPVAEINKPNNGDSIVCDEGSTIVSLEGTGTDPDNDPLTFVWSAWSEKDGTRTTLSSHIINSDKENASINFDMADSNGFCAEVSSNCNFDQEHQGCAVSINLDVNDGTVSDNDLITIYVVYPL